MSYSETLHQARVQLWDLTYTHYLNQELLSPSWLGVVAMMIIFYIIWLRIVDKSRLIEILLYGSLVSVMAAFIDIVGTTMAFWHYNVRLFPIMPAPFPFDYTVVPILLMLSYQFSKTWNSYLGWSTLSSGFFAFGISPLFQVLGIKSYYNFSFLYFFILMLVIAIIAKWVTMSLLTIQEKDKKMEYSHSSINEPQPAFKPHPEDNDV